MLRFFYLIILGSLLGNGWNFDNPVKISYHRKEKKRKASHGFKPCFSHQILSVLQEIFNEKLGSKLMETRLRIHKKRLQKLIELF